MADFKKEIDDFVKSNGVGAHFEYTEKGRKIKDKYNKPKVIFDNLNIMTKLAELLAKYSGHFIRATNFKGKLNGDLESYYYEAIYDIAPHYKEEAGKSFSNFFIQYLTGAFMDIYKRDRIVDPEDSEDKREKTDANKQDGNDKTPLNKISRFTGYTFVGEDGEEFDRKELEVIENGYSDIEESGRVFEVALQIVKILNSLTKSKQSMSRLFFTDDVIYWLEDERDFEKLKIRHSQEVFENLDKDFLDYIMSKKTKELADIIKTGKKTLYQLASFLDGVTDDNSILTEYKAAFNLEKLDEENKMLVPESPLGNNMFLAYLFAMECVKPRNPHVKPVMHASSYVTKYRYAYRDLLREFIEV